MGVRGAYTKQRLVAQRTGTIVADLPFVSSSSSTSCPFHTGKRVYPSAPTRQSVVDNVVFGRDMDNSGEEQFDDEFMCMFKGGAGATSGVVENHPKGLRPFPNAPTMQSVVDSVVFGRDMDGSGETQFDGDFLKMYEGAAGKLTIDPRSRNEMRKAELQKKLKLEREKRAALQTR